ncbi:MAG: Glycosyl transferase group 1 [Candidatus Pacebacteria bacterium GW2011_GWF1_36_5]|nr:MAG: Glycosyl transferase group 1 [Candidatus Pacebacteria bacterium GW2011_GWF1_36_5]
MIKILCISDSLGMGGTEKSMFVFAKYLLKNKNFKVSICGFFEGGKIIEEAKEVGLKTFVCNGNFHKLKKIILNEKTDIVHLNRSSNKMFELIRFLKKETKVLLVETNHFGKITGNSEEKLVDLRIFVSKFVAMRYIEHKKMSLDEFKINNLVIYNPLDTKRIINFSKFKINSFRKSIGLKNNDFVLLKYGRKDELKFSPLLIKSMSILSKKNDKFKLILIGAPDYIRKMVFVKKIQKSVIFFDNILDEELLSLVLNSVDVLAHTSLIGETFGYVYVESMLSGKPIITNSTPLFDNAQVELIDNNINGFIRNEPLTFSSIIEDLSKKKFLYELISKNALIRANKFDVNLLGTDLINAYEYLIGKTPSLSPKTTTHDMLFSYINSYSLNKRGKQKNTFRSILSEIEECTQDLF